MIDEVPIVMALASYGTSVEEAGGFVEAIHLLARRSPAILRVARALGNAETNPKLDEIVRASEMLTRRADRLKSERDAAIRAATTIPEPSPTPMILTCPSCSARHIDEGEFATKPHHLPGCGMVWRPALVPTVGVQFLPGFKNAPEPVAAIELCGCESEPHTCAEPSPAPVAFPTLAYDATTQRWTIVTPGSFTVVEERPTFETDCKQCVFLGGFRDPVDHAPCDLYYCDNGGLVTVIARYGDASSYTSGLVIARSDRERGRRTPLAEALARAEARGLITPTTPAGGSSSLPPLRHVHRDSTLTDLALQLQRRDVRRLTIEMPSFTQERDPVLGAIRATQKNGDYTESPTRPGDDTVTLAIAIADAINNAPLKD